MEFIGIDVHKRASQVCILAERGEVVLRQRLRTQRERLAVDGLHEARVLGPIAWNSLVPRVIAPGTDGRKVVRRTTYRWSWGRAPRKTKGPLRKEEQLAGVLPLALLLEQAVESLGTQCPLHEQPRHDGQRAVVYEALENGVQGHDSSSCQTSLKDALGGHFRRFHPQRPLSLLPPCLPGSLRQHLERGVPEPKHPFTLPDVMTLVLAGLDQ